MDSTVGDWEKYLLRIVGVKNHGCISQTRIAVQLFQTWHLPWQSCQVHSVSTKVSGLLHKAVLQIYPSGTVLQISEISIFLKQAKDIDWALKEHAFMFRGRGLLTN